MKKLTQLQKSSCDWTLYARGKILIRFIIYIILKRIFIFNFYWLLLIKSTFLYPQAAAILHKYRYRLLETMLGLN